MNRKRKKLCPAFLAAVIFLVLIFICGCASGPKAGSMGNAVMLVTLRVSDKGMIDMSGKGYYCILFNGLSQPIEVTNFETFTDFIRFDGANFTWYHRQGNVPSPGYTWVDAGNMNSDSAISSDGKSVLIRINFSDTTNLFNQYIQSSRFTTQVLTTDSNNSLLGRAVDTLGQGPSFDGNSQYTVFFDRTTGILNPQPPGYPSDPLQDYDQKPDLSDFPYDDYDISSFTLEFD
jgi:hypothetical protein